MVVDLKTQILTSGRRTPRRQTETANAGGLDAFVKSIGLYHEVRSPFVEFFEHVEFIMQF